MDKRELLLIALGSAGKHSHTPVQVQKLLFLIEKNIGDRIGGPIFDFAPYDYGPFDASVYEVLRELEKEEFVSSSVSTRGWKLHALTDKGVDESKRLIEGTDPVVTDYIKRASEFVRSLSFPDLVSAIYKAYPEMKENSVFRD
ncbi:MAG: hypothetical protein ACYDC8_00480 [Gammaproteobacteria bacterium]